MRRRGRRGEYYDQDDDDEEEEEEDAEMMMESSPTASTRESFETTTTTTSRRRKKEEEQRKQEKERDEDGANANDEPSVRRLAVEGKCGGDDDEQETGQSRYRRTARTNADMRERKITSPDDRFTESDHVNGTEGRK